MLKVVGIITIVFAAISILGGFGMIGIGSLMASMIPGLDAAVKQVFSILGIVILIVGAVDLIFGIFGIRYRNRAEKAQLLIIFGVVQIIITVASMVYSNMMNESMMGVLSQLQNLYGAAGMGYSSTLSAGGFSWTSGISFILPVLYIIGAILNKRPPIVVQQYPPLYGRQPNGQPYGQSPNTPPYGQQAPYGGQANGPQPPYGQQPYNGQQANGGPSPYSGPQPNGQPQQPGGKPPETP
jgi:hypothetical protein